MDGDFRDIGLDTGYVNLPSAVVRWDRLERKFRKPDAERQRLQDTLAVLQTCRPHGCWNRDQPAS